MGALDTSFNRYNEDWDTSKIGLDNQYDENQRSTKQGFLDKRSTLLQTLASLRSQRELANGGNLSASVAAAQPYISQVGAIGGQIDALGVPKAISVQNPTYAAPDLAQYNYDKTGAPQLGQGASALQDTLSPYLSLLLKGKKNQPTY
jgi:hypothetical protein